MTEMEGNDRQQVSKESSRAVFLLARKKESRELDTTLRRFDVTSS